MLEIILNELGKNFILFRYDDKLISATHNMELTYRNHKKLDLRGHATVLARSFTIDSVRKPIKNTIIFLVVFKFS